MADQVADATLEALGYKPEFKRVLSQRDLILYGLVILTPTAPYPVYGIVQQASHGHAALAYLVAMVWLPGSFILKSEPLVRELADCAMKVLGNEPPNVGIEGPCDMYVFHQAFAIPAVLWGARGGQYTRRR
jgi:hypothetical protein